MDNFRSEERRSFTRFPVGLLVSCIENTAYTQIVSETSDICAHGLGLISKQNVPVGTDVDLFLTMPDNGEQVPIHGEVVWSKSVEPGMYRMGIIFSRNFEIKPVSIALRTIEFRKKYQ